MGFRARLMAWLNFSDLAESNDVPHGQIGRVVDFATKAIAHAFWGVGASVPTSSD